MYHRFLKIADVKGLLKMQQYLDPLILRMWNKHVNQILAIERFLILFFGILYFCLYRFYGFYCSVGLMFSNTLPASILLKMTESCLIKKQ